MPSNNLKPCPNPKCTNTTPERVDVYVEREAYTHELFATRHRMTCRFCSYSSGWWDNLHEMVAWWNKHARKVQKKAEQK